jgi:hypothetical protein
MTADTRRRNMSLLSDLLQWKLCIDEPRPYCCVSYQHNGEGTPQSNSKPSNILLMDNVQYVSHVWDILNL